jgi:hypothetical protein
MDCFASLATTGYRHCEEATKQSSFHGRSTQP